jgi:hypothetical protein
MDQNNYPLNNQNKNNYPFNGIDTVIGRNKKEIHFGENCRILQHTLLI